MVLTLRTLAIAAASIAPALAVAQGTAVNTSPVDTYVVYRDLATDIGVYRASPVGLPRCSTVRPFDLYGYDASSSCMPDAGYDPIYVFTIGTDVVRARAVVSRAVVICAVPPALLFGLASNNTAGHHYLDRNKIGEAPACAPGDQSLHATPWERPVAVDVTGCELFVPNATGSKVPGWAYSAYLRMQSVCAATNQIP